MPHRLSLEHLTVASVDPLELLDIAEACGCHAVNVRMEPAPYLQVPYYEVIRSPDMQARIRRRSAETGVRVHTVDPFVLREETTQAGLVPFLDAAANIGSSAINVVCYDPDIVRLTANLDALADAAGSRGLDTRVELFAFSAINSLEKALALADAVDGKVTLNADILHLTRTGARMETLAKAPRGRIGYAQICDGPATKPVDEQMAEATLNRLVPGTGAFDLAGFLQALPADIVVGMEVPSADLTAMGLSPLEKARRIADATRSVMERAVV